MSLSLVLIYRPKPGGSSVAAAQTGVATVTASEFLKRLSLWESVDDEDALEPDGNFMLDQLYRVDTPDLQEFSLVLFEMAKRVMPMVALLDVPECDRPGVLQSLGKMRWPRAALYLKSLLFGS